MYLRIDNTRKRVVHRPELDHHVECRAAPGVPVANRTPSSLYGLVNKNMITSQYI